MGRVAYEGLMDAMSAQVEWTETGEHEYEGRGDGRRYLIFKQSNGDGWTVVPFVDPTGDVDIPVTTDPVSAPTLEAAKQIAQRWEDEPELWRRH